jgi:hypothetical protein
MGTAEPGARLSFNDLHLSEEPVGIAWYNPEPTAYGIHRTAGPWSSPDYQQLRLGWVTGIVLDPGTSYGKSYVDIKGNGLRVSSGNVGIGTATPRASLSFIDCDQSNDPIGMTWYGGEPLNYGIHRTAGSWAAPDYQQLRLSWKTGIILDPGMSYGKSYVDIAGNGLRVTSGNVGIGISTPQSQLHTTGSVRFAGLTNDNAKDRVIVSDATGNLSYRDAATLGGSSTAGWNFGGNAVPASSTLGTTSNYDLPIITNNTERMRVGANGNVGIGTTNITGTGYKLFVDGNIRTRKVRVDQDTWADYVFESNYKLRPIKEVEQYIQKEKHLPDVPSAAEVKKEGLDLGDNQAVLLKKIEELTLYVIEQNKRIDEQQKQLLQQQAKIEALENKDK